MELTSFHLIIVFIIVLLMVAIRYGFEKLLSRLFRSIPIKRTGVQIFTRALILILFNIAVLALSGLFKGELFSFTEPKTGMIILGTGLGFGIIVAVMSLFAIKAGYGGGYQSLASTSTLEKGLSLFTFLLLAGPSEDLFFIGFVQNALTPALGWAAIIVYLVIFIAYHFANVISGVENKKEFLALLPIRLVVSLILSLSFYLTGSLMYGMIVHNVFDTLSYAALLFAAKPAPGQVSST